MKNRLSTIFCSSSKVFVVIASFLLITGILPVFGSEISGAIWTTDPKGKQVNGNLFKNPRDVNLAGGPYKEGALGLPDGEYLFQVTDPSGKTLLSSDPISQRDFMVIEGKIIDATHPTKSVRVAGDTITIVQLWPFDYTAKTGGEYKVWVTKTTNHRPGEGCFGFVSSLSKTDNFKVKMPDQSLKAFELWVTGGVFNTDATFYVNYTVDADGDPNTWDPEYPWTTGQLLHDRAEDSLEVFRYETTFTLGSYVYWQFNFTNAVGLPMETQGPELITGEMVNKEFLFRINGTHYNSRPTEDIKVPVNGSRIVLSNGTHSVETITDEDGYYEFIAVVPEASPEPWDYRVSLVGSDSELLAWFEDKAESPLDWTYDFFSGALYMSHALGTGDYLELTEFDLVWTPSNEGEDLYKLSSTNPGSFHFNIENIQDAGTDVYMEIRLPDFGVNDPIYDWPNFLFHHQYIGGTYVVDFKVHDASSNEDITHNFTIAEVDEKTAIVTGRMPASGIIVVTLHLDYQIDESIPEYMIEEFDDHFVYYIEVIISGSGRGARLKTDPHSGRGAR